MKDSLFVEHGTDWPRRFAVPADFDEVSPGGADGYGQGKGWAGQRYTYVKSVQVFKCPDDAVSDATSSSYAINNNTTKISPACLAANYDYGVCGVVPGVGTPLAAYNSPAKTVLLFEVENSRYYDVSLPVDVSGSDLKYSGGSAAGKGVYESVGFNSKQWSDGSNKPRDGSLKYATGVFNGLKYNLNCFRTPDGRHTGGANYLMADDHAKWLRASTVSPGGNANHETDAQINDDPGTGYGVAAGTGGTFLGSTVQPVATFSLQ